MKIKIGLHAVTDFEAYHISEHRFSVGDEFDTSYIDRDFQDGDKFYIESLAEKTRLCIERSHKIKLPSRNTCLFVCDKEHVKLWYSHMDKHRVYNPNVIYKVRLSGILFVTYSDYLRQDKYWRPNENLAPQEKEGLFEGLFRIVEACSIDDFK